jgi:hypothetical protein
VDVLGKLRCPPERVDMRIEGCWQGHGKLLGQCRLLAEIFEMAAG